MGSISILFILLLLTSKSYERRKYFDDENPSLCDDPMNFKTDRLVNNSVRIYKKNHYWELIAIPDKSYLLGPYRIWYPNLAPVGHLDSLTTELVGPHKGSLYRFRGDRWWGWRPDGSQWHGGSSGARWDQLNNKIGFNALFHDGNASEPLAIALDTIFVRYYSTKGFWWYPFGAKSWSNHNGYDGGMYSENFPPDVDAAFSWPADDPNEGYMVYFFKKDKYCLRPRFTISAKECDVWKKNTELFGCNEAEEGGGGHAGSDEQKGGSAAVSGCVNIIFYFIFVCTFWSKLIF